MGSLCIRFGSTRRHYVINLPRSFELRSLKHSKVSDLESSFEKGRRSVNPVFENWQRLASEDERKWNEQGGQAFEEQFSPTNIARFGTTSLKNIGSEADKDSLLKKRKCEVDNADIDCRKKAKAAQAERKLGASSSFYNGLNCSFCDLERMLLEDFGFFKAPDFKKDFAKLFLGTPRFEADYTYEIDTLDFTCAWMRPKRWVSAAFILDKTSRVGSGLVASEESVPDLRLRFDVKEPIRAGVVLDPVNLIACIRRKKSGAPFLSDALMTRLRKNFNEYGATFREIHRYQYDLPASRFQWRAVITMCRQHEILQEDGTFKRARDVLEMKLKMIPPMDEKGRRMDLVECIGDVELVKVAADGLMDLGVRIAAAIATLPALK
ncbi:hypothetical protein HDU67_009213 [Dinochytrium kinnereticum]|nr:hypothetical protein HDU67_009213 [Dinochytrium kinnereticum]